MKRVISYMASRTRKPCFLAVDGGGTKTDAVLFSKEGDVTAIVKNENSTNPNIASEEQLNSTFSCILANLGIWEKEEESFPTMVFAGLAGGYNITARKKVEKVLLGLLPNTCQILVGHDAISSLWSGTQGNPGIAIIAGTGSMVYARNNTGTEFRIGGWGHLISDEGSAYHMGQMALKAMMDSFDGIAPETFLTGKILEKAGIKSPSEIIPFVYNGGKAFIASIAQCVTETCENGDATALNIIDEICSKLMNMLDAGISKANTVGGWDEPYQVVLTGGLWKSRLVTVAFEKKLRKYNSNIEIIFPKLPPLFGAAIYLATEYGINIDEKFLNRFTETFLEKVAREQEG